MPESLKKKSVKGVSWSFAEQVLTRGVNFIIGIILARLLSPTDYGLVGMLGVFVAVSQIFIDGGLASALIRQKETSEKDFSTVYIINIVLSIFFYFLLFFIAPLIANFYSQPLLKSLLRVTALTLVIGSISSVQGTILTIRVDFKKKTIISIATALCSGITGIICAYRGLGVWALVGQSLAASLTACILTLILVRWMPRPCFSIESFKKLFSFGSRLLTASLISTLYDNVCPLIIGKRFSAKDVGLFSRAGQFPGIANETMCTTFNRVSFPILSQIQDDNDKLVSIYEKYIQVFCFLTFPLLLGICGCARPLVSFLLTDKWLECVPYMQIICFALLPIGIVRINLNLLYVKGRSDLVLRMEIIKKIIMFLVLVISSFFGLKTMCFAIVLNSCIDMYFSSIYTKKILGYPLTQQLISVLPYFLLSLVLLAESLFASHFISNNIISLIVSILVCAATYWLLSRQLKLYAYTEAKDLVRSYIKIREK